MNDRQVHIELAELADFEAKNRAHMRRVLAIPRDVKAFYAPLFRGIQLRGVLLVLSSLAMATALCYLGLWVKERFNVDLQPVVAVAGNKQ